MLGDLQLARNTMVPHIETVLKPGALRLSQAA